jgi:hypothetical protein
MKRHSILALLSTCLLLSFPSVAFGQQASTAISPDRAKGISLHMLLNEWPIWGRRLVPQVSVLLLELTWAAERLWVPSVKGLGVGGACTQR